MKFRKGFVPGLVAAFAAVLLFAAGQARRSI